MSNEADDAGFSVHKIESSIIPLRSIAICTAYRSGQYLIGESYVLIQRSETETVSRGCRIEMANNAGSNSPIVFNEEFAEEQALEQAKIDFSLYSHEVNMALPNPTGWARFEFVKTAPQILAGLWSYSALRQGIDLVARSSRSEALGDYLASLRSLPTMHMTAVKFE